MSFKSTMTGALLAFALTMPAVGEAEEIQNSWTLFPESLTHAETVEVRLPERTSFGSATVAEVFVGLPNGCFRTSIELESQDEYTHVLRPILRGGGHPCVQASGFELHEVDLGYLPVGEHTIMVENVARPVTPKMLRVTAPNDFVSE